MFGILLRGSLGILLLSLIVPYLPRPAGQPAPPAVQAAAIDGADAGAARAQPAATAARASPGPNGATQARDEPQSETEADGLLAVLQSGLVHAATYCSREPQSCAVAMDALSAVGQTMQREAIRLLFAAFPQHESADPAASGPSDPASEAGTLTTSDLLPGWRGGSSARP